MSNADADFPSDLRALEREYELIRELGQGGMAAVYLARNRRTGRLVAIKAIRARYLDDSDAIQRFAREARTVAGLDHPNIVRTEAIEQIGDRAVAIIMEHVPGGTVRDRLRERGSLGAEEAESILRDVASALGYAHRRGIVHRDVKPENIFLDEQQGRALLSDFGIARQIDGDAGITLLGAALGTPQYMSPEQIDGQVVDGRSDIYSLGVLGWELLTGRRPWAGESLYGIIYKQKHENLPRITSLRPRVPANLLFAIERALVKDKKLRWQNTEEFLDQLTYNPPPLLEQSFPPGARRSDDQPTIRFRPLSLVRDDDPAPSATDRHADDARDAAAPEPMLAVAPPQAQLPVAQFAAPDDPFSPSGDRELEAATLSATELVLPTLEPNAESTFELPSRRRQVARALGILVPLAIATSALYIVLGGSADESADGRSVESSTGSLAMDSASRAPAVAPDPVSPSAGLAAKPAVSDAGVVLGDSISGRGVSTEPIAASPAESVAPQLRRTTPRTDGTRGVGPASGVDRGRATRGVAGRTDSNAAAASSRAAADSAAAKNDSLARAEDDPDPVIEDPFKIPPSMTASGSPSTLGGKGTVPSQRCRIAAAADQRACLDAYIAVGDVPLTQAFAALVSEVQRISGTAPGAPDPQPVVRVRVEQRAWLAVRNEECPRTPDPEAGPFWAAARSVCFTEMAQSRAGELRDAVRRLKRR